MNSLTSEWVAIDQVSPWENNPRINEHVVQQVAVSIQQFGFLSPIIAQRSTSKIIAGNTRYKASLLLGLAHIPVVFADLDDSSATAYAIADNKLGELADWDDTLLASLLKGLQDEQFNISALGFDDLELSSLLSDIDESPAFGLEDFDSDEIEFDVKATIAVEVLEQDQPEILTKLRAALAGYEYTIR